MARYLASPSVGQMPEIDRLIRSGKFIPNHVLMQYRLDPFSSFYQLHNRRVKGEDRVSKWLNYQVLWERADKYPHRGLVVQGLECSSAGDLLDQLDQIGGAYSGLSVYVESPRDVAIKGFEQRARPDETVEVFQKAREGKDIGGVYVALQERGTVVKMVNDGLDVGEAIRLLGAELAKAPRWQDILTYSAQTLNPEV
ncbi:Uu.00g004840.m01.CDS01 [Anthostomella pinea]|uniref:Uu.00g004840.m01.CDS01 n=1 Tax=Anthostomella pinea TaxID=933095 RepID=A0AAI8VJY4_9PEZI|nr:Uu.00g004840.m01.CDS01 [Anthostomella pinea]